MWTNFTFNQSEVFKDFNLESIPKLPSGVIRIFMIVLMNIGLFTIGHAANKIDLIIIDSGLDSEEFNYLPHNHCEYEIIWVDDETNLNDLFCNIFKSGDKYSSAHIISHAKPGILIFGQREVGISELEKILDFKKNAAPENIFFYGCNFMANEGIEAIKLLENAFTEVNFHGSTDITGIHSDESNLILEYSTKGHPTYATYLNGYQGRNLQCQIDYFAGCDYTVNKIAPPSIIGVLLEGTDFGDLVDTDLNNFVTVNTTASSQERQLPLEEEFQVHSRRVKELVLLLNHSVPVFCH